MCSVVKMQTNYVWIIILLANVLIVTSSNVERPKRDVAFLRNIIANLFGCNTNIPIMTNENNINILYPVPYYQTLMNFMPGPYMNQIIYQRLFPKILIPRNMVMQPVNYFGRPNFPYITAFGDRNSKTANANLNFSPVYGNLQRVIPVPNYNNVKVPLARCNDKIPDSCRKSVTKDKTGEVSNVENVQKFKPLPVPSLEKKDKKNKSKSTARISTIPADYMQPISKDNINNNFNPFNLSKDIVTVNSNKTNEDTDLTMNNIKYPKNIESQGDLMVQPSIFNNVIDLTDSVALIRGEVLNPPNIYIPQDTDDTLEEIDSDDMELNDQSTDVYPSESEELDYLNRPAIILDDASYGSIQEEGSQNKSNESEEGFRGFMPSDSATDISRGDVPDV